MDRPKDRFIHQSAFLFYFFMTAGVLIVAAGSLLQHYFALRHPVFIPMHIELEMYWDGGMDEDTMGSMDGNADVDAGSAAKYIFKVRIIHIRNPNPALFEQQTFASLVIFKIFMFIRSDMVFPKICKNSNLKRNTRSSVKHQPLR